MPGEEENVSGPSAGFSRVLIADDDPGIIRTLAILLGKWGYEVVAARDGEEAWAALQAVDSPRLAILDWMMPGLDGLEVCRRARGLRASEPPYLILLTGREAREDLVAGLEGGADEYLTKPVDPEELRARVHVARRLLELQVGLAERVRQLEAAPLVREVVGEEHAGLRQTLRLCVMTFTEVLALPGVPRHLRIAVRTCRGLSQEALGEDPPENGAATSPASPA
jgi:DNA-binding response OmpR family regulator